MPAITFTQSDTRAQQAFSDENPFKQGMTSNQSSKSSIDDLDASTQKKTLIIIEDEPESRPSFFKKELNLKGKIHTGAKFSLATTVILLPLASLIIGAAWITTHGGFGHYLSVAHKYASFAGKWVEMKAYPQIMSIFHAKVNILHHSYSVIQILKYAGMTLAVMKVAGLALLGVLKGVQGGKN